MDITMRCLRLRKPYITKLKRQKILLENIETITANPPGKKSSVHIVLQEIQGELSAIELTLADIEEQLPLSALIVYRQFAMLEILEEQKKEEMAKKMKESESKRHSADKSSSSSSSAWFGGMFSSSRSKLGKIQGTSQVGNNLQSNQDQWSDTSSMTSDDEDVSIDSLRVAFERGFVIDAAKASTEYVFHLQLNTAATFQVSSDERPVVSCHVMMSATADMKAGVTSSSMYLHDLNVFDLWTEKSVINNLLSLRTIGTTTSASATTATSSSSLSLPNNNNSKFTINVTSKENDLSVEIQAIPFVLVWNKPCIQQLLDFFVWSSNSTSSTSTLSTSTTGVGSGSGSGASAATIALGNFSRLSAAAGGSGSKVTTRFILEAEAPRIILPENYSVNNGYLYLDAGHLSVRGTQAIDGITFNASLTSIHAAFPTTLDDIEKIARDGTYLIRPFNVNMSYQDIVKTHSDVSLDLKVYPEMRGEIRPEVLSKLFKIIEVVTSSVTAPQSAMAVDDVEVVQAEADIPVLLVGDHSQSNQSNNERAIAKADAQNLLDLKSSSTAQKTTRDLAHVTMAITIVVPTVAMELKYDNNNINHLLLAISDVNLLMNMRMYDMKMSFNLGTLCLQESQRIESQKDLARTPEGSTLVKFDYIRCQHPKSPYYQGYGSEIHLDFSQMDLNVDAATLLHLRPYMEVFLALGENSQSSSFTDVVTAVGSSLMPSPVSINNTSRNTTMPPTGMFVKCSLTELSLELLRVSSGTKYHMEVENDRDYDRKQQNALESVFAIAADNLFFDMGMKDGQIKMSANLKSLSILDTCDTRSDYLFRKILSPSDTLLSSVGKLTSSSADSRGSPSPSPSSKEEEVDNNTWHDVETNNSTDLITFSFTSSAIEHVSHVNVIVRDMTSYLSMDTALDLIDVLMCNVNAILVLVAPVNATVSTNEVTVIEEPTIQLQLHEAVATYKEDPIANTMYLRVTVNDPRIFLLEDPTLASSRAIMAQCGVQLQYNNVGQVIDHVLDVKETIHAALEDLRFSVIPHMTRYNPQLIIMPTAIDVHYNRHVSKDITLRMGLVLEVADIEARISLNDILLMQTILMRVAIYEPTDNKSTPINATDKTSLDYDTPSLVTSKDSGIGTTNSNLASESSPTQVTIFEATFNLGKVNATLVNDFNGQNIPIAKILVVNTNMSVMGFPLEFSGTGQFSAEIDYYNPMNGEWEPLLETWKPSLSVNYSTSGIHLMVDSASPLQLTVSGILLKTVLQTYSQMLHFDDVLERDPIHNITIHNYLGVPVELCDSDTQIRLVELSGFEKVPLAGCPSSSISVATSRQSRVKTFSPKQLDYVDLHVHTDPGDERSPVLRLPVKAYRTKSYYIQSTQESVRNSSKSGSGGVVKALEPVVESVLQNQRYDPFRGWSKPFLAHDPHEFSDINGNGKREMSSVTLPNDQWGWQRDWAVDMSGAVGKEIDPDGWDYGFNFLVLSASRKRRTYQPLDTARRRRWIRVRSIKPTVSNSGSSDVVENQPRPWMLFWDIALIDNGSRIIKLRSRVTIVNTFPFTITVAVSGQSWQGSIEVCTIKADDECCVPLPYVHAMSCAIKLAELPYEYSEPLPCGYEINDYESWSDICCRGKEMQPVHGRVHFKQSEKALTITIASYFRICNNLPCDLQYKTGGPEIVEEMGLLGPGAQCHLLHCHPHSHPMISFQTGNYAWCDLYPLQWNNNNPIQLLQLTTLSSTTSSNKSNGRQDNKLMLSMESGKGIIQTNDISVFSTYALIDRSGFDMAVRSKVIYEQNELLVHRCTASDFIPTLETSLHSFRDSEEGVTLGDLTYRSTRPYKIHAAEIGSFVYTDRDWKWTYLPPPLLSALFLSTPFDDRAMRADELVSFTVSKSAIVLVCFDVRVAFTPRWIRDEGYSVLVEQAVSQRSSQGNLANCHYVMWGKLYKQGDKVVLGSNASRDSRGMYVVFVVPSDSPTVKTWTTQIGKDLETQLQDTKLNWVEGTEGLTLFHSSDAKIALSLYNRDKLWSGDLPVSVVGNAKGKFEIIDDDCSSAYQLAYSVSQMPGVFRRTKVVTVMPHYCIVNRMVDQLEVRQMKSTVSSLILPWQYSAWHKANASLGTLLQFRCGVSDWSLGGIDINEIGSSMLYLPVVSSSTSSSSAGGKGSDPPIIIHVEVKEAEANENCCIVIVVWQAVLEDGSILSVKNDCDYPVTLRQSDVLFNELKSGLSRSNFEVCVPSGSEIPYGWADPQCDPVVTIAVGTSLNDTVSAPVRINLLSEIQFIQPLFPRRGGIGGEAIPMAFVAVQPLGRSRVLRILNHENDLKLVTSTSKKSVFEKSVSILFNTIALSIVIERPIRRELLNITIDDVNLKYQKIDGTDCVELLVGDFQIDNYSDSCVDTVLLYTAKKENKDLMKLPALQISIARVSYLNSFTLHYKYVAVRLLEVMISVDSGTLYFMITQLLSDLEYVSWDQALAVDTPARWMSQYNLSVSSSSKRLKLVDVYLAQLAARANKMYFEKFVIHPIKISLTFVTADFPKEDSSKVMSARTLYWLELLPSITAVSRMPLRIRSFQVNDALESASTLISRITSKMTQDMQSEIGHIIGSYILSLSILGRPAGLARNIGSGVQDFFYEPYEGLMQSPQEFLLGIGRGTTSLVSNVVSGALNTTASIVGSATGSLSRGMNFINQDEAYSKRRAIDQKRKTEEVAQGGLLVGLREGGGTMISGVTSGITGLVYRPLDEAKKDGAVGFFRGVGLGILGVAVKPVLGVSDGLATMFHGLSSQIADSTMLIVRKRPARVLEQPSSDSPYLLLKPLDINAAFAQEFVNRRAQEGSFRDSYLSYASSGEALVILSENYVYILKETSTNTIMQSHYWTDISHVIYDDTSIGLVLYGSDKPMLQIPCKSKKIAKNLYTLFYCNASRMGNANECIPPELITSIQENNKCALIPLEKSEGEISNYKFGTANTQKFGKIENSSELVLLSEAAQHFPKIGYYTPETLDTEIWKLVWTWDQTHKFTTTSRCCAALFLNRSDSIIQITKINLREGRNVNVFGCLGFDDASQSLLPGGCVLVFLYSFCPSIVDKAHCKADVVTTAMQATLGTRPNRTTCSAVGSFKVGFLEKSQTDWWCKYVIEIL